LTEDRSGPLLAVSSGGAISQMINATLGAAPAQKINLKLQMKNCAVTQFFYSLRAFFLQNFNETPHITDAASRPLISYS
jgi:broad specificity phosphatase PhoE